jgi:hypothetical protein
MQVQVQVQVQVRLVEAGSRIIIRIPNRVRIVRECVEEAMLHVADAFCVVAEEAAEVVVEMEPEVDMTIMKAASGCWFVAVVLEESVLLIALVKFVPTTRRVLLQHRSLLLFLPLHLRLHPHLLLAMTHHQPLALPPLPRQRSLVRQSPQPSKYDK